MHVLVLVCIFFCTEFIAVTGRSEKHSTNKTVDPDRFCYNERLGVGSMRKGEYKTILGTCIGALCDHDGVIYYEGCGKWKLPPTCKLLVGDLSKPYPQCCPYIDCY